MPNMEELLSRTSRKKAYGLADEIRKVSNGLMHLCSHWRQIYRIL